MKLSGEFVVRQVADTIVAVPVGQTALRLNGMIMLNEVSKTAPEHHIMPLGTFGHLCSVLQRI